MQLSEIDLCSQDVFVRGVPHEMFRTLRREAPVFFHPEPDGPGFWAVTRYHDVIAVSRDPATFSSEHAGVSIPDPADDRKQMLGQIMLEMDPPKHARYRMLVNKGFTPRALVPLEPHVREMVSRILDPVAASGACEFVTEVAAELPLQVIAEFLGVPHEDRLKVFEWSNRMIGAQDPDYNPGTYDDARSAMIEMFAYANALAEQRRRHPALDLVSTLLAADVDGEQLSDYEFDLFFMLLAVAGNETTRNLISGGMLALIEHPAERERLVADPSLMPTAVEEMLRWVSPVMHFRRTAMRDTEVGGQPIRAGEKVVVWYVSANRDAEAFDEPDRFDVGRTPNEHLAFGIGEHFCLGANLARLEIRVMFEEILRRMPRFELEGEVRRLRSNFIGGIKRMPVRATP
jgi:cytochrome P450